jgi:hypothetical protein
MNIEKIITSIEQYVAAAITADASHHDGYTEYENVAQERKKIALNDLRAALGEPDTASGV